MHEEQNRDDEDDSLIEIFTPVEGSVDDYSFDYNRRHDSEEPLIMECDLEGKNIPINKRKRSYTTFK